LRLAVIVSTTREGLESDERHKENTSASTIAHGSMRFLVNGQLVTKHAKQTQASGESCRHDGGFDPVMSRGLVRDLVGFGDCPPEHAHPDQKNNSNEGIKAKTQR